jgi:hypothetical protein
MVLILESCRLANYAAQYMLHLTCAAALLCGGTYSSDALCIVPGFAVPVACSALAAAVYWRRHDG